MAASRSQQDIAAQPSLSVPTESPDVEDVVEDEDPVVNSPVPADMSLGMPTMKRRLTLAERQGSRLQKAAERTDH